MRNGKPEFEIVDFKGEMYAVRYYAFGKTAERIKVLMNAVINIGRTPCSVSLSRFTSTRDSAHAHCLDGNCRHCRRLKVRSRLAVARFKTRLISIGAFISVLFLTLMVSFMVAPPDPFMMMEAPPIASEIYSERHQAVFKSLDAVFDAPDAGVTVLPVVELIYTNEAVLTPGIAAELPYSDDEIAMLAKTVWGEARGCSPVEQKLVVWTVFQRVDNGRWGDTIKDVLTAPSQFQGYRARNPVHPDIYALCEAEAADWAQGAAPPTLAPYAPNAPYFYFNGHGGHNWFRAVWRRAS